jgi:hypothetical protein
MFVRLFNIRERGLGKELTCTAASISFGDREATSRSQVQDRDFRSESITEYYVYFLSFQKDGIPQRHWDHKSIDDK